MVDDGVVGPSGDHGYEPLGEALLPELLLAVGGHVYHGGRLSDVVRHVGRPGCAGEHIVPQGVHLRHGAGVEHGVEELFGEVRARLGAAGHVEVVLIALLQFHPGGCSGVCAVSGAVSVCGDLALAGLLGEHVVLQLSGLQEVGDDLGLHGGVRALGHPHAELAGGGLVAVVEHVRGLAVHPAEVFLVEGLGGLVLIDAHAVEDEREAHDEVVAVAWCEDDVALLEHLPGALEVVAQWHADGVALLVEGALRRLHPDQPAVVGDAQFLAGQAELSGVGPVDGDGVVRETHHAVDVLALLVHGVAAPDGVLPGDAAVDAGVDVLGALRVILHVDLDALGQDEGHDDVEAEARDALVGEEGVVGGAEDGLHPLQFVGGQAIVGGLGVEVDEHAVEALAAVVLGLAALHAEADGHLGRGFLYFLGGLLAALGQEVAVEGCLLFQFVIAADDAGQLLKVDSLRFLAVECLE